MVNVSVIIPNYNHSRYLNQRIDSVLNQTYSDFEVIILDDCSTDNSREIIEQYRSHQKVKSIIFNEHNSGTTFKQWEKGINIAQGNYVWIAESDDWCDTEFLESAVQILDSNSNVSLFFSRSNQVNEKGEVISDLLWWTEDLTQFNWKESFLASGAELIKSCLIKKNIIVNASAVVFRKSDIPKEIFSKVRKLRKAGDWLFWTLLIADKHVYYHGCVLNHFRDHSSSTRNYANIESRLTKIVEEYYVKLQSYQAINDIALLPYVKKSYDFLFIYTPAKHYKLFREIFYDVLNVNISLKSFLYKRYTSKLIGRLKRFIIV